MISKRYGKIGIAIAQTLIIAYCAGQPISTVTSSSVQRAIVTQVCAGEDRPAPYAWILWAIATAHLIYVVYLLFPESFEDLLADLFANEEKSKPLYISEATSKPACQPSQRIRPQPEDNEALLVMLENRLSKELPKPLVQLIYLAILRQGQFKTKTPEDIALFLEDVKVRWGWEDKEVLDAFYQLEAMNYGECHEVENTTAFVLFDIEGV